MACTCPREAWPAGPFAANRRPVFSAFRSYQGARPFLMACGQCNACRLTRASEHAVRGMHEFSLSGIGCSLTMTYDQEHVPQSGSLSKRHWQLFAKKLREREGRFRFMMCGEYGDENRRPHMHAVLFGMEFDDKVPLRRSQSGELLYESSRLTSIWGQGEVAIGNVTLQSIEYIARYTMKKRGGALAAAEYHRFDGTTGECWQVEPEFFLSSRRPGIGAGWFDRYADDAFPSDFVTMNGRKVPVPSFYAKKLDERDALKVKAQRKRVAKHRARQCPGEDSDRRMLTKHESRRLKASRLKREL